MVDESNVVDLAAVKAAKAQADAQAAGREFTEEDYEAWESSTVEPDTIDDPAMTYEEDAAFTAAGILEGLQKQFQEFDWQTRANKLEFLLRALPLIKNPVAKKAVEGQLVRLVLEAAMFGENYPEFDESDAESAGE